MPARSTPEQGWVSEQRQGHVNLVFGIAMHEGLAAAVHCLVVVPLVIDCVIMQAVRLFRPLDIVCVWPHLFNSGGRQSPHTLKGYVSCDLQVATRECSAKDIYRINSMILVPMLSGIQPSKL